MRRERPHQPRLHGTSTQTIKKRAGPVEETRGEEERAREPQTPLKGETSGAVKNGEDGASTEGRSPEPVAAVTDKDAQDAIEAIRFRIVGVTQPGREKRLVKLRRCERPLFISSNSRRSWGARHFQIHSLIVVNFHQQ